MLQMKDVVKEYVSGSIRSLALDHVDLRFRDSEFVAVLGPSGAGKTTLLNLIGGLDHCDSGEVYIDGCSTADYKSKDWDYYRNRKIGFVFQSYNLIPHQTVLRNVELAMTIAGVSRKERKLRAQAVLEQVGLQDQMHKLPSELSGGQKQRVAIARALVNDPDVLLADEPTGSLDSQCSRQIVSCLQEIAKDRLVIMVTHDTELVKDAATRIIQLRDGKVVEDSHPYEAALPQIAKPAVTGKVKMRFLTSLHLSFHNLRSKKGRTLFAMLAGAIGIIGIALILALSTGLNDYILGFQKRTLNAYPITISTKAFDITDLFSVRSELVGDSLKSKPHQQDGIYGDNSGLEAQQVLSSAVSENDLAAFMKYLQDPGSEIHNYIGENGIVYRYDANFQVYAYDPAGDLVNTDSEIDSSDAMDSLVDMLGSAGGLVESISGMLGGETSAPNAQNFSQLLPGDGKAVSKAQMSSYELLYGAWPESYDGVVLVLDKNNAVSTGTLYQLGLITRQQYDQIARDIQNGLEPAAIQMDYGAVCGHSFYLIPACDLYVPTGAGTYYYIGDDPVRISQQMENALQLKITGIVRPVKDATNANIQTAVAYTQALTDYLHDYASQSAVVKAQEADPKINILTGLNFSYFGYTDKAADAKTYIANLSIPEKAAIYTVVSYYRGALGDMDLPEQAELTPEEKAAKVDGWLQTTSGKTVLVLFYNQFISNATLDGNLRSFGKADPRKPSAIQIYTDSFEDKEAVAECIARYNEQVEKNRQIHYTDYVELLTGSFRSVIDVITYVLIAFVAVSLVVCCIMIGIITHISVLERRREIGVLRSLGASKAAVCQVFNAENIMIGFGSGLAGVCIGALLTGPVNGILWLALDTAALQTRLPLGAAVALVIVSVIITVIGGLIPALRATKRDPIEALRAE